MVTSRQPTTYTWVRVSEPRPLLTRGAQGVETFARGVATNVRELSGAVGLPGLFPWPRTRALSFQNALATIGVPTTDLSPEDELVDLLQRATEIEHGLMAQYLYATYSMAATTPAVSGVVRLIAIEEMGHLISVQNLLIACGAAPHFANSTWRTPTRFQPFPFKLEPGSRGSLAKYTVAEMPDIDDVPQDIKPSMPDILAAADAQVTSPIEAHRVGLLYAQIYWLLRPSDEPMVQEPWPGFPVTQMASNPKLKGRHVSDAFIKNASEQNALPAHWKGNFANVIVIPISGRDTALQMIAKVSGQGEGFGETPDGHFDRFAKAWISTKSSPDLSIPTAIDPFYDNGPPGGGVDKITSVDGIRAARLADAVYEMVLLCIAANLLFPSGTAASVRANAARAAIFAMRDCLKRVAFAMAKIPLTDTPGELKFCGLPFSAVPEPKTDVKAVVERAKALPGELRAILDEIDQGNGADDLKGAAQDVRTSLDDDIAPLLDSLPS